jgi:hypothetical protein
VGGRTDVPARRDRQSHPRLPNLHFGLRSIAVLGVYLGEVNNEMIKTTGVMVRLGLLAVAAAAIGCGVDDTEPNAPSTVGAPQETSGTSIVHASLSLGKGHELKFVEFKPGVVGVVEKGRVMLDVPHLTPELQKLPWVDVYRHFAGTSAPIPKGMAEANARALAKTPTLMSPDPRDVGAQGVSPASTTSPAPHSPSAGEGPHFYNDAEQAWFRSNFCNGARKCIQGWNWTEMQTDSPIGRGTAYALVGSEGTQIANFVESWWDCAGALWPWPEVCEWINFYNEAVVPGGWVGMTVSGPAYYIRWDLQNGGATDVSSSAYY